MAGSYNDRFRVSAHFKWKNAFVIAIWNFGGAVLCVQMLVMVCFSDSFLLFSSLLTLHYFLVALHIVEPQNQNLRNIYSCKTFSVRISTHFTHSNLQLQLFVAVIFRAHWQKPDKNTM